MFTQRVMVCLITGYKFRSSTDSFKEFYASPVALRIQLNRKLYTFSSIVPMHSNITFSVARDSMSGAMAIIKTVLLQIYLAIVQLSLLIVIQTHTLLGLDQHM